MSFIYGLLLASMAMDDLRYETMKMSVPLLAIYLLFVGCAHQKSEYETGARLPTPKFLTPNSTWAFVLLTPDGKLQKSLIVRLTNEPAKTECDGDQRRIDIISDSGVYEDPVIHNPTYVVEGAAMRISLSTYCDDDYALIGAATPIGFEGVHARELMISPKRRPSARGRVYGVPLTD